MKKVRKTDWLYAVGKAILFAFYRLVYRIRIEGRENLPASGPVLLCCNHIAKKDPLMLACCQKRQLCFMGKAELFENKFLGTILRLVGVFPVQRGTGGADALENAYRLLDENGVVGIFIEGTRSKTGELQKPKTGAALIHYRTKAPVVPACITGEGGTFCRPFRRTLIKFGKPLTEEQLNIPDEASMHLRRASRAIMAEITALRERSRKELGLPLPEPENENASGEVR